MSGARAWLEMTSRTRPSRSTMLIRSTSISSSLRFPPAWAEGRDRQGGKEHRVKIESVKPEQLGDQTKLVISFVDRAKQFVSNKTNSNTIADAFGTNTDSWEVDAGQNTAAFDEVARRGVGEG